MCLCTIVYEGNARDVEMQIKYIHEVAKKYKGFFAGRQK
jgi:hypothetical protein